MKDFNRGEWKDKIYVLDRLLCLQGGECVGKGPDSRQRDELGGYCCNPDGIQNKAVTVVREKHIFLKRYLGCRL